MIKFLNAMKKTVNREYNVSITENGALGYRTTGKELLDINFSVSSMRNMSEQKIIDKFVKTFYEDKLLAVKWLFYAADVREGMGERRLFRICFSYLAKNHKDIAKAVLQLIPEYTRWDNLFVVLDTELFKEAAELIQHQLMEDLANMTEHKPISLLAKWMPSVNASSEETRRLARLLIAEFGMTQKSYRKMLSQMREYLKVVEVSMSAGNWEAIDYAEVPSRANLIYRNAFLKNDEQRRKEYLNKLEKGEEKIHAGVLFPHDIVHSYCEQKGWMSILKREADTALEEMWKALPDYVQGNGNTICVADGSGSMNTRVGNTDISCLDVANALAIYFSERCHNAMKNQYITFSEHPQFVQLGKAENLREKIEIAKRYNEMANTNIEAVFDLILQTAVHERMKQEEMPANILILSDMEFDNCAVGNGGAKPTKEFFTVIAQRYARYGYKLPRLVFWNICSRTGTIPVRENALGVALVSGFSPAIMKMVLSESTNPLDCLLEQLNAKRYDAVEDAMRLCVS